MSFLISPSVPEAKALPPVMYACPVAGHTGLGEWRKSQLQDSLAELAEDESARLRRCFFLFCRSFGSTSATPRVHRSLGVAVG
ncbi:MAG: hypothetical protein M1833_007266 [Piccolia ochrophora]|nr:MAG: hypothetical protein M1833_007266 [Piccolia ochrophora]